MSIETVGVPDEINIPQMDECTIRAIACQLAMQLQPEDVQALMAIADVIVDYIDPLGAPEDMTLTCTPEIPNRY
ncbi:MAG: hypothetical protein ABJC88_16805 [Parasphingorhabdus sp.]|uniref:hypothetical protein n=1 Tax=Sphingomonadales TaxID=204457 RepID=UPI0032671E06